MKPLFNNTFVANGKKPVWILLKYALLCTLLWVQTASADTLTIDSFRRSAETLYSSNPHKALELAKKSLKLSRVRQDTGRIIGALSALGAAYQMLPNLPEALTAYFEALRMAEKQGDSDLVSGIYSDIGAAYIYNKQFDVSYQYLTKAVQYFGNSDDLKMKANTFNNIGLLFSEKGEYAKSIEYYLKVLEIDSVMREKEDMACTLINIADVYRKQHNIRKARVYYMKALPLCQNNPYYKTACFIDLGLIERENKRYDSALHYLHLAEDIAKASGLTLFMARIYGALSGVYERQKDLANALSYYKLYQVTRDSAYNLGVNKQISELRTIYEGEKKDEQIHQLMLAQQRAEEERSLNRQIRNLLISISVLVVVVCVILGRNILLKQRYTKALKRSFEHVRASNDELNIKNQQIKTQKEEIEHVNQMLNQFNLELKRENISAKYEVLQSKVNPHFLFNSLTTLSAIIHEDSQLASQYISSFSKMYRSILDLADKDIVTFQEELEITKQYLFLQQMKFGKNVNVHWDELHLMKLEGGLPPLSLQMVVENVFKHNIISERNPLRIEIYEQQRSIVVKNNLQRRNVAHSSTKTGVHNIQERYRFMDQSKIPDFVEDKDYFTATLPLI